MAKFYGPIGYANPVEERPGIWTNEIIERMYYGELLSNHSSRKDSPNSTNDNLSISNRISILADPYANQNFHSMLYVEFMGTKWKATSVTPKYPRLIMMLGGVYNGQ